MSALPHLLSYMQTWVTLCICSNQPTSSPTYSLACVHGSVHVLISIWLHMYALPHICSYMENGFLSMALCGMDPSHFWSYTLVRMCTCISTCIYVHLTPQYHLKSLCIVTWKHECHCVALCLCPSHLISVPTPCIECVHVSMHLYLST